jgi:hypothetical protein
MGLEELFVLLLLGLAVPIGLFAYRKYAKRLNSRLPEPEKAPDPWQTPDRHSSGEWLAPTQREAAPPRGESVNSYSESGFTKTGPSKIQIQYGSYRDIGEKILNEKRDAIKQLNDQISEVMDNPKFTDEEKSVAYDRYRRRIQELGLPDPAELETK